MNAPWPDSRPRGRKGGRKFALSKAQARPAQAADGTPRHLSVRASYSELGIKPVTLYRYRRAAGRVVRAGRERSSPLEPGESPSDPQPAAEHVLNLSVGFRPLPQTTRRRCCASCGSCGLRGRCSSTGHHAGCSSYVHRRRSSVRGNRAPPVLGRATPGRHPPHGAPPVRVPGARRAPGTARTRPGRRARESLNKVVLARWLVEVVRKERLQPGCRRILRLNPADFDCATPIFDPAATASTPLLRLGAGMDARLLYCGAQAVA